MSLEYYMLPSKPSNWQQNGGNYDINFVLSSSSQEYMHVAELMGNGRRSITRIQRVQNTNFYCQFLCRREYIARAQGTYYSVRQFLRIPKVKLTTALTYNLDRRRMGMAKLSFTNTANCDYINSNEVVLVIHALLPSGATNCTPTRSSEYYIEYIVYF